MVLDASQAAPRVRSETAQGRVRDHWGSDANSGWEKVSGTVRRGGERKRPPRRSERPASPLVGDGSTRGHLASASIWSAESPSGAAGP